MDTRRMDDGYKMDGRWIKGGRKIAGKKLAKFSLSNQNDPISSFLLAGDSPGHINRKNNKIIELTNEPLN